MLGVGIALKVTESLHIVLVHCVLTVHSFQEETMGSFLGKKSMITGRLILEKERIFTVLDADDVIQGLSLLLGSIPDVPCRERGVLSQQPGSLVLL